MWRRRHLGPSLALLGVLVPAEASATYSIVAVDTRDGTVGGAVASCVGLGTVERVYGAVPGRGALVTQSYLKDGAREDGLARLAEGAAASDAVGALIAPSSDPDFGLRQYAAVDVSGGVFAFTGPGAIPFASHETFAADTFVVSVQGNVLTGRAVLDAARTAFTTRGGCDLPARLVDALEAAGAPGQGDDRCADHGVPARSITLEVDRAGEPAGSYLKLAHESAGEPPASDPTVSVRAAFDAWRQTHPCPPEEVSAGGGDARPRSPPEPAPDGCAVRLGRRGAPHFAIVLIVLGISAWSGRRAKARPADRNVVST